MPNVHPQLESAKYLRWSEFTANILEVKYFVLKVSPKILFTITRKPSGGEFFHALINLSFMHHLEIKNFVYGGQKMSSGKYKSFHFFRPSKFQKNFLFSKLNFSTVFEMWSGPIFTEFSVRKGQNSHLVNAHPQFSKELLSSAQMIWNIFWEHVQCRQPNLTANIYLLERGEKHFWWSVYCSYGQDLFCWYKCLCHWSQHLLLT